MSGDAPSHRVSVLLDDALLTLNRAVGVLRRRNLPVADLAVAPSGTDGVARLTFRILGDAAAADRVVQQFHKMIGVREVAIAPGDSSGGGP
jgi:acetolactate synthase small subunit